MVHNEFHVVLITYKIGIAMRKCCQLSEISVIIFPVFVYSILHNMLIFIFCSARVGG